MTDPWTGERADANLEVGVPEEDGLGVSLIDSSPSPVARILVIEDNLSDVFLLERALRAQGFQFELVHMQDGDATLAYIRRQGAYAEAAVPSLILMDLNLPKYTGVEILHEIRAARHLDGVPVCVWSSSQSRKDQANIIDIGVARFITKPTGLDEFMQIGASIRDLIAGRNGG